MLQEKYAIEVIDVKKKFKVYFDKGKSLKEKILFRNRNHHENRWVLKGISFKVKKGEAIGLVGHNGCGKSTTLKLLTRIMYPDQGEIKIKGRVSSLIELGAGFHPDMSGRENIYINASIFGLTKKEIDSRIQKIIDFSELEDFLDNPVRTYSSGMYMRLAFSVAINVDADVLLIDEILGVGDVNFQTKCFEKLKEIKANGTTIVIVSHALEQIELICEKSYWLEDGLIKEEGIPKYVHESYLATMENRRIDRIEKEFEKVQINTKEEAIEDNTIENKLEKINSTENTEVLPSFCGPQSIRRGNKLVEFTNVQLLDKNNQIKNVFTTGDSVQIKMTYKCSSKDVKGNFGIGIFRDDGVHCYGTNVLLESDKLIDVNDIGEIMIKIESLSLLSGKYMLDIAVHSKDGTLYDDIRNISEFYMTSNKKDIGVSRLENKWFVDDIRLQ